MPDVDGFQLYQKVRKTDNKIKICFLTASEYHYERFRKEHGFSEFNQESFLKQQLKSRTPYNKQILGIWINIRNVCTILVNISSSTFLGHIAPYGCPTD